MEFIDNISFEIDDHGIDTYVRTRCDHVLEGHGLLAPRSNPVHDTSVSSCFMYPTVLIPSIILLAIVVMLWLLFLLP